MAPSLSSRLTLQTSPAAPPLPRPLHRSSPCSQIDRSGSQLSPETRFPFARAPNHSGLKHLPLRNPPPYPSVWSAHRDASSSTFLHAPPPPATTAPAKPVCFAITPPPTGLSLSPQIPHMCHAYPAPPYLHSLLLPEQRSLLL